jgi:hypothetical protein
MESRMLSLGLSGTGSEEVQTVDGEVSWVVPALLGLTSAGLCIAAPPLAGLGDIIWVGLVYGASLGIYFAACRGIRSGWRLPALIVTSMIAYLMAYWCALGVVMDIPGMSVHEGDALVSTYCPVAVGGVVGGIVLLIPLLLIYKPARVSWGTALVRALLGIVLSGIVGGVGWELGPTLGATIWHLLRAHDYPQPGSYGTAAVFLVWQPVMAMFIGWATSESRRSK